MSYLCIRVVLLTEQVLFKSNQIGPIYAIKGGSKKELTSAVAVLTSSEKIFRNYQNYILLVEPEFNIILQPNFF